MDVETKLSVTAEDPVSGQQKTVSATVMRVSPGAPLLRPPRRLTFRATPKDKKGNVFVFVRKSCAGAPEKFTFSWSQTSYVDPDGSVDSQGSFPSYKKLFHQPPLHQLPPVH